MRVAAVILCIAWSGGGCSQNNLTDDRPEDRHIYSRVAVGDEGEMILGATFTGGGAGDTTYKLLACRLNERRCETIAAIAVDNDVVIDNDPCRPEVRPSGGGVSLVVDPDKRVGIFQSFSRTLPSLAEGPITLHYRRC
jgi:hypothetical protein